MADEKVNARALTDAELVALSNLALIDTFSRMEENERRERADLAPAYENVADTEPARRLHEELIRRGVFER